jgi:D-sedoheptulose 7-phosphate isomerase
MSGRGDTSWAAEAVAGARDALAQFAEDRAGVERIAIVAQTLAECFESGGKVLICGNGGSSADAMHFAEELTGRFRKERTALPALACTDPGHITCAANDYGFENVFSRWVEAHGRRGDVVIVLSTSGNSENILRAVNAAKDQGCRTIALLGKGGGKLAGECDFEWIVVGGADGADEQADRIQEVHMIILHALIEGVERVMYPDLYR